MNWRTSATRLRSIMLRRLMIAVVPAIGFGFAVTTSTAAATANMSHKLVGADSSWYAVSQSFDKVGNPVDTFQSAVEGTVSVSGPPGLEVHLLPQQTVKGKGQRVDHRVGIMVKSPGLKKPSATALRGPNRAAAMRLVNSLYNTICISYTSPDRKVYFYGCDNQYLDLDRGGYDWYMADKMQISGRSTDARYLWGDHLTSLDSYVNYGSGNQVTQWNPINTVYTGTCQTITIGITSNQTGINYSQSQQVCPNNIGIYTLNSTQFGTIWRGYESYNYEWEGTEGVDEVHSPPYAPAGITYYGYVNWCSWC